MASLSSSPRLGNTSTSALLRSSQSLQNQINSFNDEAQRLQFENNPSDANLQSYLGYLQKRVDTLNSSADIASQTKAMTLGQTMRSAIASNTSFSVQNENIQIMSGNATPQDKLQQIGSLYQRALSVGDIKLAQELMSQGYSLSQQIQYQQQVAADASKTLAKANDTALKEGYTDAISQIKSKVADALAIIHSGAADPHKALADVSSSIDKTLKDLTGQGLPKGQQANIGAVIQGAFNAEFAYAQHAADVLRPSDPAAANKFATYDASGMITGGQAGDILSNQAFINVPGLGNVNAHTAAQWANNPNLYGTSTDINGNLKFTRNQITGYTYMNGILTPLTDQAHAQELAGSTGKMANIASNLGVGTAGQQTASTSKAQLEKLGFSVQKVNSDGTIEVKFTNLTDKWTNGNPALTSAGLGSGRTATLIPQANGSFQFASGNRLLNIGFDTKGLGGIFETQATGGTIALAGQYGFNQKLNTLIGNATIQQLQAKAAAVAAQAAAAQKNVALKAAGLQPGAVNPAALQGGVGPSAYQTAPAQAGSKSYQMTQRSGGGFNFTNNGQAVSAATYAQLSGTPFRTLLQTMANQGDSGARTALGFVGNDYGYNPGQIGGNGNLYNSLVWGTGQQYKGASAPNTSGGQLTLPSGFKL